MDALKALAAQQGCTADGTATTRNPISNLINKVGSNARPVNRQGDQAMAAGMGLQKGPMLQGPQMMPGLMASDPMVQRSNMEFNMPVSRVQDPTNQVNYRPQQNMNNWADEFATQPMQQFPVRPQFPAQQFNMWGNQGQFPMRPAYGMQNNFLLQQQRLQAQRASQWNQQRTQPKPVTKRPVIEKEVVKEHVSQPKEKSTEDTDAIRQAAEELTGVMSGDEKLRKSKFFSEMSKVANGDSVVTGDGIEQLRDASPPIQQDFEIKRMQSLFEEAYDRQASGEQVDLDAVFKDALANAQDFGNTDVMENAWDNSVQENQVYELETENQFKGQDTEDNLFDLGMELFRKGELKDAILAFQAVLDKDMANSEAWRMLGVVHQELDEDRKAIICLENAKEQDPYNLNALLELGVSYVNELDQKKALANLKAWVDNNPKFAGIKVDDIYGDDSSDLMHDVAMLMAKVEEFSPQDPDVQVVMGVLFNVTRDYDDAVKAFQKALNFRPDDYSLWNKLGATLANSSKSEEALPVYTRAIELKPKYARGWLNFGISHSNLGDYSKAIRAYLRALELNPDAVHIWGYLRICLTVTEGYDDLMPAIANRDIDAFRKVFDF